MKPFFITFILWLFIPCWAYGQYFQQYFDGADTSELNAISINIDTSASNLWQIGKPRKNIFDSAATYPNAIVTDTLNVIAVNNTSRFTIKTKHVRQPSRVFALQWMQKIDFDTLNDGGIIEFSVDSGNTWQNAFNNPYVYNFYGFDDKNKDTLDNGTYAFTGTDSTWRNIWLCFDLSWLQLSADKLFFRFTLVSDSVQNNNEGWMIDNMLVYQTLIHTINAVKPTQYMTVSPNPTSGRIDIHTMKIDDFHIIENIELHNIEDKVVQRWGVSPTKFYIDIGSQPDGVYFLHVKTNIRSETFKIMLQH